MMRPQYAYFDDPLKLSFQAQVEAVNTLDDGHYAVSLDQTYFYPTGGGQEHDTGMLGDQRVVDVWRDESTSRVVHVVKEPLSLGPVQAQIDPQGRYRNMQHHTAQHLLSACFQRLFDLETLSANINGFSPSTIDLPETRLTQEIFDQVEYLASEIIFQNLEVKTYFVEQKQLQTVPLRRPPKVQGEVRVVEIDGYDYSACGGTHCLQTGMIGVLKILKSENLSQRTRIHFIAGFQALAYFQSAHRSVSTLADEMSIHSADLIETVRKQTEDLKQAQRQLRALDNLRIAKEVEEMLEASVDIGGNRLVCGLFQDRPGADLQSLAKTLRERETVITVLGTRNHEKLSLIVACANAVPVHAGDLLKAILEPLGGRGGGGPQMAQGGGSVSAEQFEHLLDEIAEVIQGMI